MHFEVQDAKRTLRPLSASAAAHLPGALHFFLIEIALPHLLARLVAYTKSLSDLPNYISEHTLE
jgi:hypothetical protein